MAPSAGDGLGPYEILGSLGAGGMGEVYRARDPRLGRTVAIKVLPASVSADASRRHRFEHEARTTGLLNHPNILVVYDVGDHEGAPYLVTELLEGETLRERLGVGPIPARKAVDYALQAAHGLAAAHDKGVVHRDLKPENLFLTKDGVVKILDFGLALHEVMTDRGDTRSPTLTRETGPGVVLGTVGYMSPEQARGETADHRSDIFSLGAVLYEMLTGRRAFHGDTAVETLNAILKQEPEDLAPELKVPPSLDRVVRHCLEKKREDRFQSARDVAFALETLGSVSQSTAATVALPRRTQWLPVVAAVVAATAFTALGLLAGRLLWEKPQPTFSQLTFRRGFADYARFAPDGRTVIYGAAWDGEPSELFMTRTDTPESRPLGLRFAKVLSISGDGRMLVLLDPTRGGGFFDRGTLAEVPVTGGVPREILEGVVGAEWTPGGRELCVARQTREGCRIELPPGQVLYASSSGLAFLRLAPTGSHVAFLEGGQIVVVDRVTRERRVLVEKPPANFYGLAWAPDGREVWYTAGPTVGARDILAVDLHGHQRVVYRSAGVVSLLDTRPDGRALLHRAHDWLGLVVRFTGEASDREMTVSGGSAVAGISADGRAVLLYNASGGGGDPVGGRVTHIRRQGEPDPIRIAEGRGQDLSPDGGSALVLRNDGLYDVPVGAGVPRRIDLGGIRPVAARFVPPDASRIVVEGRREGSGAWFWLVPRAGGPGRPLGPESRVGPGRMAVGPRFVAVVFVREAVTLIPLDGGPAREVGGLSPYSQPASFNSEDGSLFLYEPRSCELLTLDLATGKVHLFRRLGPADRTALVSCFAVPSSDGRAYAYMYNRSQADVILADGLR
jgi:hypothetical protein